MLVKVSFFFQAHKIYTKFSSKNINLSSDRNKIIKKTFGILERPN